MLCRYRLGFRTGNKSGRNGLRSIAETIVGREGDYFMSVKENQPKPHEIFQENFSLEQLAKYEAHSV